MPHPILYLLEMLRGPGLHNIFIVWAIYGSIISVGFFAGSMTKPKPVDNNVSNMPSPYNDMP